MKRLGVLLSTTFAVFICFTMLNCGSSKPYKAEYEAAWSKIIQSKEWRDALVEENEQDLFLEGSADSNQWLIGSDLAATKEDPFFRKYNAWVSRAYIKLIADAEVVDVKIKAEYDRFLAENPEAMASSDENIKRILALYRKKYQSHQKMLSGLKSWHALEDYGSDDLKFFKAENQNVVRSMYRNGYQVSDIVNYLVYKLADLYHIDTKESSH